MKTNFLLIIVIVIFTGCSKMEEKKTVDDTKSPVSKTPETQMQTSTSGGDSTSGQADEKAASLVKEADEVLLKYSTDKSDEVKKETVAKCLTAANYLMFEANLPAREKYRPALKYYRQIIAIDPKNQEAATNKKQIEDIYESMGMPIPQ
ncbi:MAG: hypothetical protein SGI89_06630 [bacterium]|nr:hypothetical protein [bacterium]